MDGAPQQADELGASQLTQPPPVLTQPSQFAVARSDHGRSDTGGRRSVTGGRQSDTSGRRSDIDGRRSDTGRQSDTGYCRLVAGVHGDTVSRPLDVRPRLHLGWR
jgi:hypothetical protein